MLRRINRWRARRYLCRRMCFQRNTPDQALRYLANTMGNARDKLMAAYLD